MAESDPILQLGDLLDKTEILQMAEAPKPPEATPSAPASPSVNSPYMPGFPGQHGDLGSVPANYYRDFLYSGFAGNYLQYLYSRIGQMVGSEVEKAKFYNICLKSLLVKEVNPPPLTNNCINTSRIMLMKLYGMLPLDFKTITCLPKTDVGKGGNCDALQISTAQKYPKLDCEVRFGLEFSDFIKQRMNLTVYQFIGLLGITGISGPSENVSVNRMYKHVRYFLCSQFDFQWIEDAQERVERVNELINLRIMTPLQGSSPQSGLRTFKLWSTESGNLAEFGSLEDKKQQLIPVMRRINIGVDHFSVQFRNPFNFRNMVLDPWPSYGFRTTPNYKNQYDWYLTLE